MGAAVKDTGRSGAGREGCRGLPVGTGSPDRGSLRSIYRMAWRLIGTREEAQDVAQDVCVKLASSVRSFRGNAEFSTWLYRVSYNTAIDHMRARERLRQGERPDVVVLFQGRAAQSAETAVVGSETLARGAEAAAAAA